MRQLAENNENYGFTLVIKIWVFLKFRAIQKFPLLDHGTSVNCSFALGHLEANIEVKKIIRFAFMCSSLRSCGLCWDASRCVGDRTDLWEFAFQ